MDWMGVALSLVIAVGAIAAVRMPLRQRKARKVQVAALLAALPRTPLHDHVPEAATRLEYRFAHEAFREVGELLGSACGGRTVDRLIDPRGDDHYWDFEVRGERLTLTYDHYDGTRLYNALPTGKTILASLRDVLDTERYPILEVRD